MTVAPALIATSTQRQRKSGTVRVASSALHSTSDVKLRARVTEAPIASSTAFSPIFSLCFIWTGLVEMKVWMRGRWAGFPPFPGAADILEADPRQAADAGALDDFGDLIDRLEIACTRNGKA